MRLAALPLSCLSIATASAEEIGVPKRSAYPQLQPSTSNKPGVTPAEQEKLKKELSNAAARAKTPTAAISSGGGSFWTLPDWMEVSK
jgi:hypothetical protein